MIYNIFASLLLLFFFLIYIIGLEYRNSNQNENEDNPMSDKKENWVDSLLKAGAFIGGAWLLVEVLKMLSKKVYRCPNCHNIVKEDENPCPNCKAKLIWKD
ncbi:MAG: hypothetical protein ABSE81_02885 [Candidatus Omnitrophota bacterium]|jgi:rubrerythrin